MPLSRTKTESKSADFFMKQAETDRLQDFENRNNTRQLYVCVFSVLIGCDRVHVIQQIIRPQRPEHQAQQV